MENRNLLELWIAATTTAINNIDLCLSVASRRGNEDEGQRLGVLRARCKMDLACLLAARDSSAGETAQVRYFPADATIVLAVGDDVSMDLHDVPAVLKSVLLRHAEKVLRWLGYRIRKTLVVQQVYHPEGFVVASRANAAPLPN